MLVEQTLDGPYIFGHARRLFGQDFRVLWALMYTYRNQQRRMFHFQRLNQVARCMKHLRTLELDYSTGQGDLADCGRRTAILQRMLQETTRLREAVLVAAACNQRLLCELKILLPFATVSEACLAGMLSRLPALERELQANLSVYDSPSASGSRVHERAIEKKPGCEAAITKRPTAETGQEPSMLPTKRPRPRQPTSKLLRLDTKPASTLSSRRLPSDLVASEKRDEIDDIFGGLA
jgi:hypothetical protein